MDASVAGVIDMARGEWLSPREMRDIGEGEWTSAGGRCEILARGNGRLQRSHSRRIDKNN